MNEQRFVVSDVFGSGLSRIFQVRSAMPEQQQETIGCFWKQSCGVCAPARRGAICHRRLAIGTASSDGFVDGPSPVYSRFFSTR